MRPAEEPAVIGPGQLSLPFEVEPAPGGPGGPALAQRANRVLHELAQLGWRLTSFTMRWALRIVLPVTGVVLTLRSFPYRTTVQDVPFRVQGTVFDPAGLSATTTVGNWEFPAVDGLPIGIQVSPENVDVVQLARAANADPGGYARRLQAGFTARMPHIMVWLGLEVLVGLALGLAAAAGINMALKYLRRAPRRSGELRHRLRQLATATVVVALVALYGVLSYNPHWIRQSRLTGTLAAAQLFPSQLKSYYQSQSKATDVLGSVLGIQGALQDQIEQVRTPETAFHVMFISDLHLAAVYPFITQYARNYDVKLIVNTGDESEFGTRAELTETYVQAISDLTRSIPMLWLAGNHDSPEVENVIAAIPGVTVLGRKSAVSGGFAVTAAMVAAFGLTIAGVPDPRVYGAPGAFGSDEPKVTDPLERTAMQTAVTKVPDPRQYDIFATHEPVAAAELRALLPGQIRQTNSGHVHAQNATGDIQKQKRIDLVEGSTGAGGLDNIVRGVNRPPIEFSIESVAADCQFTKVLRFAINSPQLVSATSPQAYGDDVAVSTDYFRPQDVKPDRVCSTALGISALQPL